MTFSPDPLGPIVHEAEEIDFDLADKVDAALETAGPEGLTPSRIARKIGDQHVSAELDRVLAYLVHHHYAHTSGNGAWTHYHPGRR